MEIEDNDLENSNLEIRELRASPFPQQKFNS